jgi:adenylosuccinate lyase
MMTIFSARERASTWRQLWVWLAEAEKELGLPIPDDALEQMRANIVVSDKAFAVARDYEAKFRVCMHQSTPFLLGWAEYDCADPRSQHDVMAHVHAYGEVRAQASPKERCRS